MDYIHSNSQESLLYTKIRDISRNDTTTKETMDFVKDVCTKRSLDIEKVAETLNVAIDRTKDIRSIYGFVRKITLNLDEKAFKLNRKKPIFTSLNKALEINGIVGETWELFLIHSIEEHCLNEFHVKAEDLTLTNRAIVEYCKINGIKTLSGFKDLLLRSKPIRACNVPMAVLEAEAKRYGESHDKIMKDLEEDESLYGESEEY